MCPEHEWIYIRTETEYLTEHKSAVYIVTGCNRCGEERKEFSHYDYH
jgi:hypothetical protein